ncbi:MAG: arginine repressor, partial [Clostridia bacterium]
RYKYVAQQPKELSSADKFMKMFKNTVLSIKSAENLIVLKTETGSAGPAAALIDKLNFKEVLGVVAGDDTILVVVDSIDNTDYILEKLEDLLA